MLAPHIKPNLGIPVLTPDMVQGTFFKIQYRIVNDNNEKLFTEGEYWTHNPLFVDQEIGELIDNHGREDKLYTWNWSVVEERQGPPADYTYTVMHIGRR